MKKRAKVAVLGAGNQGLLITAVLLSKGLDVSLWENEKYAANLESVAGRGGITLMGTKNDGLWRPSLMTTEIERVLEDCSVVFFALPAFAHEEALRSCIPFLVDDQLLVFISYFSALRAARLLNELDVKADVTLGELLSCVYAGRRTPEGTAIVAKCKHNLPFAAHPAGRTGEALSTLGGLFDGLRAARNCLETSINNINPWVHVAAMILNAGRIEATGGDFAFYSEGKTPAVKRLERCMDAERSQVAEALGLPSTPIDEMMDVLYAARVVGTDARKQPRVRDAPECLDHRYLTEDVPYGLLPIALIGRQLGLQVPLLEAAVGVASVLVDKDFWLTGLRLGDIGLECLTADAMNQVAEGV